MKQTQFGVGFLLTRGFSVLAGSVPARCSSARRQRGPCGRGCPGRRALRARGASGAPAEPDAGTGTCVRAQAPRSPSAARLPAALRSLPWLHPRGDLLTIKSAAAAVQSPVPASKGEDNVPADRIEFLLLQSPLITLQTAHHTAILQAPERAPR